MAVTTSDLPFLNSLFVRIESFNLYLQSIGIDLEDIKFKIQRNTEDIGVLISRVSTAERNLITIGKDIVSIRAKDAEQDRYIIDQNTRVVAIDKRLSEQVVKLGQDAKGFGQKNAEQDVKIIEIERRIATLENTEGKPGGGSFLERDTCLGQIDVPGIGKTGGVCIPNWVLISGVAIGAVAVIK